MHYFDVAADDHPDHVHSDERRFDAAIIFDEMIRFTDWSNMLRSLWGQLLKEARNHLFFRKFRNFQHIQPFQQHSVQWTMFFDLFQSERGDDCQDAINLKEFTALNSDFRHGIRWFIDAVETALNDVKHVVFTRSNITGEIIINHTEIEAELSAAIRSLSRSNSYERWFIDNLEQSR